MSKRLSMIFPDIRSTSDCMAAVIFSKSEIRSAGNFGLISGLIGSIANYSVQKNRTRELRKQINAQKETVDTQFTEAENQAQIEFQEKCKRLAEEYKMKSVQLETDLTKAEAEADKAFLESNIAFDTYLKTSIIYRNIFSAIKEYSDKLSELLREMQDNDIVRNTQYYVKLSEEYRIQIRLIEKYSKLTV